MTMSCTIPPKECPAIETSGARGFGRRQARRGESTGLPTLEPVQTRYLLIASVIVALVILAAGAVYFLVGLGL